MLYGSNTVLCGSCTAAVLKPEPTCVSCQFSAWPIFANFHPLHFLRLHAPINLRIPRPGANAMPTYIIERLTPTTLPGFNPYTDLYTASVETLCYISAKSFGSDTATDDFMLIVTVIKPRSHRDGHLPFVHFSDDSGSGYIGDDSLCEQIFRYCGITDLFERDQILAYCGDIVLCEHDPDQRAPSKRLCLNPAFPYTDIRNYQSD